MPESDLALLLRAAKAAGDIALPFWQRDPQVWDKGGDAGPVTEADLAVDAALKDILLDARPDYGWLSEETPDDPARLKTGRLFILDPIDGTRSFIAGQKHWAHALAVVEDGAVTAAVVAMPARQAVYAAAAGEGATCNGTPLRVAPPRPLAKADVLTTKSNLAPQHWRDGAPPEFKRSFRASLAYRLCLVAEGRFDAMLTLRPTWEWDVAAGTLIVTEAGGTVTTASGDFPRFNGPEGQLPGLVAGGPAHAPLAAALA